MQSFCKQESFLGTVLQNQTLFPSPSSEKTLPLSRCFIVRTAILFHSYRASSSRNQKHPFAWYFLNRSTVLFFPPLVRFRSSAVMMIQNAAAAAAAAPPPPPPPACAAAAAAQHGLNC